jgi:hypothetical protein
MMAGLYKYQEPRDLPDGTHVEDTPDMRPGEGRFLDAAAYLLCMRYRFDAAHKVCTCACACGALCASSQSLCVSVLPSIRWARRSDVEPTEGVSCPWTSRWWTTGCCSSPTAPP